MIDFKLQKGDKPYNVDEIIRHPTHEEISRGLKSLKRIGTLSMSEIKAKVSSKQLAPFMEVINPLAAQLRTEIEKMPKCGKRTSLLVTLAALDKKLAAHTKEISEEQITAYVNKHPEVLQKLAKMAQSDEGFKEVAAEIVSPEDIKNDSSEEEKPKEKGKKKRF